MHRKSFFILLFTFVFCQSATCLAQQTDANTPLHLLKPDYKTPYGVPTKENIKATLDRILNYIESSKGTFRLTSYEWGVTYSGVLKVSEITGDNRYRDYAVRNFNWLSEEFSKSTADKVIRQVKTPKALDDAGAMCAAMIKVTAQSQQSDIKSQKLNDLTPMINNYMDFIKNKQFRLPNGMFARNRPQRNSVWLDDMFMGIPPLAWHGDYDEAARQILLFKEKMWFPERQLFRHGWVEAMDPHPSFLWARANGWALLTMCEVLDALPKSHPQRAEILNLFRAHVQGLADLQSGEGFWHQLLDRNDSYLETSATAIYTYCMAHGINQGWLNAQTYGPIAILGWNAVSTKINAQGQVEGTCVGTGMGFDPAFYYYRPISPFAAHGYGPTFLAGAEIIRLVSTHYPRLNDSATLFYDTDQSSKSPLFNVE